MSNKFLKFVVFSLVGLAVFLAGYLFSRKSDLTNQQALINNSLVTRFDKTEEKYSAPTGLFELTPGEANFPNVSNTGEIQYYVPKNGEIRSASVKNSAAGSTLIAKIQPNASYISWGTNKTLVATYSTGSIFYDLSSNYSKKYDSQIKSPALNKAGDKIAYTYFNNESGEGNISIADTKLESYKNILSTRFAGWQIHWLDNSHLALLKPPTLENTQYSLFLLDIESGALQNILDSKGNLELVWSVGGQKLAYSYVDIYTQEKGLYYMDLSAKEEVKLKSVVDASRCTWSMDNKTVYCAGTDSFVSIDTTAPETTAKEITNPTDADPAANATNLLLNSTEDYLIFKNSKDGKLYGLSLSK